MACPACKESVTVPLEPPPHPIPWEDRRLNPFRRWWRTWDRALFHPHQFFRQIPYEGGHRRPLGFVVFYYLQLFAGFAVLIPFHFIRDGKPEKAWLGLVFSLVMAPLACGVFIVLLYLFTGIDHLCLMLLGGKGSFEATLRVVAYSYPTTLYRGLPYVGKFLHPIWSLICLTFGFAAAHRISKVRAAIAGILGAGLTFGLIVAAGALFTLLLPVVKRLLDGVSTSP
jgi:hypothetical protein